MFPTSLQACNELMKPKRTLCQVMRLDPLYELQRSGGNPIYVATNHKAQPLQVSNASASL